MSKPKFDLGDIRPVPTDDELKELEKKHGRGDTVEGDGADDEEEEEAPAKKLAAKKPDKKAAKEETEEEGAEEEEGEEEEAPAKKPAAKADEAEDDEEEEAPAKKPRDANTRIRQVVGQRNQEREARIAAEARAQALEEQLQQARTPKVDQTKEIDEKLDALYVEVEKYRADNDVEKAAKAAREIGKLERQLAALESQKQARPAEKPVDPAVAKYESMCDHLFETIEMFDEGSDQFDEDKLDDFELRVNGAVKRGMKPVEALEYVVKKTFGHNLFNQRELKAYLKEQADEAAKATTPAKKKTDIAKNIDAAKRQPAPLDRGKSDETSGKIDVRKLTEKQFDKLSEERLSQLRGDTLG